MFRVLALNFNLQSRTAVVSDVNCPERAVSGNAKVRKLVHLRPSFWATAIGDV
jgi:hypothetical protein